MNSTTLKQGFNAGAIVFALAALIVIPLRTVMHYTVLEGGTGFYTEKNFLVYLFTAVMVASIAFFAVLGIVKRKSLSYSTAAQVRAGFGSLAGLAAAGFIFDILSCIKELSSDTYSILEYSIESEETAALSTASGIMKIQIAFAAISALYFLVLCLCNLSGKAVPKFMAVFSLAPVVWGICKLVLRFTRTISYIKVSELMLEMLAFVFLILFFMAFAQLEFGISSKGCEWKVAFYGLSAAILLVVCFVPRFIVTVTGSPELIYSMSKVEYCDICLALFIICTVITKISDKKSEFTDAEPTELEV